MNEAEKVKPYIGDERAKHHQVRDMFDSISPAYDFMNRAMTMGVDLRWRKKAVAMVKKWASGTFRYDILDMATGTADMAIMMARSIPAARITGVDLSEGMLSIGRRKVEEAGMANRITLETGDCLALPLPDDSVDCATVVFGVRNFEDIPAGYRELCRVIKPGGHICVVEMSSPTNPLVRPFYLLYTRYVIPFVGRLLSHDTRAYSYLPESIEAVPQGREMTAIMERAGFAGCAFRRLTFGVCTIYSAQKQTKQNPE